MSRVLACASALLTFLVTDVCGGLAWVYLFVLNRTTVVRRYQAGAERNLIFVVNHQSPLDSFLVILAAYFPRVLVDPRLHPWSLASSTHWFSTPWRTWLARRLRCLPVRRERNQAQVLRTLHRTVPSSITVYFPEGRRSPTGIIQRGSPGLGLLAHHTRATLVPVAIDGLLDAMPYHNPRPHVGCRIRISFGDPLRCDDLFTAPATRDTYQAIVDRAMAAVTTLHRQLRLTEHLETAPQKEAHHATVD